MIERVADDVDETQRHAHDRARAVKQFRAVEEPARRARSLLVADDSELPEAPLISARDVVRVAGPLRAVLAERARVGQDHVIEREARKALAQHRECVELGGDDRIGMCVNERPE